MKAKFLIKGVIKSIPGIERLYNFHRSTGGSNSARYCYSVWLRHLIKSHENGLKKMPAKIAELGPGDSIGIGLSALLSGAEQYVALDIVKFSNATTSLEIFGELVKLFRSRATIPTEEEFPHIRPLIKNHAFPHQILTDELLAGTLDEKRIERIRESIRSIDSPGPSNAGSMITYRAPWNDAKIIEQESVDMIISQAVLQHIDGLEETYACMAQWLKKDGFMSHSIDLKSMGSSDTWDGHWAYSDFEWKIVRGRKSYLINREPYSTHLRLLKENNFKVVCDMKSISESNRTRRKDLAKRFKGMSGEDLSVSGVFIQAVKPS